MIDATSELPMLSIDMAAWRHSTHRLFKSRSAELQQIDRTLQAYLRGPSPKTLDDLKQAFNQWKLVKQLEHGDWKASIRNSGAGGNAMAKLEEELYSRSQYVESAIKSRLGVLYLLSNLQCESSVFSFMTEGVIEAAFGVASNALGVRGLDTASRNVEAAGGAVVKGAAFAMDKAADIRQAGGEWLKGVQAKRQMMTSSMLIGRPLPTPPGLITDNTNRRLLDLVQRFFIDLFHKVQATVRQSFETLSAKGESVTLATLEVGAGVGRLLIDNLTKLYCAQAAPLIGGSLDIVSGVLETAGAVHLKVAEFMQARSVEVKPGMSQALLSGIRGAMTADVETGIYKTLRGAGKLALDASTSGLASPLYSLLLSAVEIVFQFVLRWYQIASMNQMFSTAKSHWDGRASNESIHLRPWAFNEWLRTHIAKVPAVAAIILNSGICVDRSTFYKMVKDNVPVSQSTFDCAGAHMATLLGYASEYLEKSKFRFTSTDRLVAACIEPSNRGSKQGLDLAIDRARTYLPL